MKRSWFSRHPLCFMALYLILYLSAFNFLNTQIHMPHILVHCRLDDLIPFCNMQSSPILHGFRGSRSPCSSFCGRHPGRTSGGCVCRCSAV